MMSSVLPVVSDVQPTQHPVVLMHGIGLIAHVLKPGAVFDPIAEDLEAQGVRVFAPRVQPYSPIRERCKAWSVHLRTILSITGAKKLNLVGFSSGGIDARYLVTHMEAHEYVASITTIASPHRGSCLAELPLRFPEPLRSILFEVVNQVAAVVFPEGDTDVLPTLEELTREFMVERFNPATPDHPDVTYYSLGSHAGRGVRNAASPLTWLMNQYIYLKEGINDGFVALESMKWTGYGGAIPADHAQLVGLADGLSTFDATIFYRRLISHLASEGW
ncbi:MAG: alpha/beta fold hydrolase [Rhodothermales bacterium]